MKHTLTFLIFFFFIPSMLSAGGISGFITDSETGEPLIGANIFVINSVTGTVSNKEGFYAINDLMPGEYELRFSFLGYMTRFESFVITEKTTAIRLDIELIPSDITTNEIVVEDYRMADPVGSTINLPVSGLKNLPSIAEPDLLRTLQLLPGIQSVNEISSGLYIRGGSPDQNLILLDGITVYNPAHLFGFFSTFNQDAISNVTLIKGGFPAEYGGRLSAVLDITNKKGNQKKTQAAGAVSLISSKLLIEGPTPFGSYMISGRRTYLDLFTRMLGDNGIPQYYFYDLNGKLNIDTDPDNKFSVSFYAGSDDLDYFNSPDVGPDQDIQLQWGNKTLSGHWTHIFSNQAFGELILAGTSFRSTTTAGFSNDFDIRFDNGIEELSAKGSIEYSPSFTHSLKTGFEVGTYRFFYNNRIGDTGFKNDIVKRPWTLAGFIQDQWKPNALWTITMGLRGTWYSPATEWFLDPRLQIKYQIQENWSAFGSIGRYTQFTTVAVNDVASFADLWFPIDETIPVQTAEQYILGTEYRIDRAYLLSAEVYYKPMDGLNEFKRQNDLNQTDLKDLFYVGKGVSQGFELFIQKNMQPVTGWIGYTFSQTKREFENINDGNPYPAKWDFTHNLSITGSYELGEKWTAGATFVYSSGTTYTVPTGYYELGPPGSPRKYLRAGEKNANRLEPYHRLDLSIKRTWEGWGGNWGFAFNIYNVYNHRNVWFRDYEFGKTAADAPTITDVRLLPILPTIELSFDF